MVILLNNIQSHYSSFFETVEMPYRLDSSFCQRRHKAVLSNCSRRVQNLDTQKLEGRMSDLSASSGSISQPPTRRSDPEANLFRTAPRHSSTAGGQRIEFRISTHRRIYWWRKFGCPELLCEDAEAEDVSRLSLRSDDLHLRHGSCEDTIKTAGFCRRSPGLAEEFVQ